MADRHLLSCSCGRETPVSPGQAGDTLRCLCGRTLEVPTLRELRRLPMAETRKEGATWTPLQGWMFGGGGMLAVAGFGAAVFFLWRWSGIDTQPRKLDHTIYHAAAVDQWTVDQTWDAWTELKNLEKNPLVRYDPIYVLNRRAARVFFSRGVACAVAGAIGLVVLAASFFLGWQS